MVDAEQPSVDQEGCRQCQSRQSPKDWCEDRAQVDARRGLQDFIGHLPRDGRSCPKCFHDEEVRKERLGLRERTAQVRGIRSSHSKWLDLFLLLRGFLRATLPGGFGKATSGPFMQGKCGKH